MYLALLNASAWEPALELACLSRQAKINKLNINKIVHPFF